MSAHKIRKYSAEQRYGECDAPVCKVIIFLHTVDYNSKIIVGFVGFRTKSFRIAACGDFAIGYIGPYGVHISASGITEKKIDGHTDYPYQK